MSNPLVQRIKQYTKQTIVYGLCILLIGAVSGLVYQSYSEARDLTRFPPPGTLIEIDGRLMHIHCQGVGSPTVVVEQGAGSMSAAWTEIHAEVAQVTRVCAYDRAGLGYSEPIDRPLRAEEVATTLAQLLEARGIDDDLVLVGWSAGGLYVREFFQRNKQRVTGMVLVESSHEQQAIRMPEDPPVSDMFVQMMKVMGPIGLLRLSGLIEGQTSGLALTEETEQRLIALYNQSHSLASILNENVGLQLDMKSETPPIHLGNLPLTVISRGRPIVEYEGMPENVTLESMQELRRKWYELQSELLDLSTNSRHIIASKSGHSVHADEPRLLIDSIVDMVNQLRD